MKAGYLNTTELVKAQRMFFEFISNSCKALGCEEIDVINASGRVLSEAVYANISAPHFYASAMDGIALKSKDGYYATETTPVALTDYEIVDTGDKIDLKYDCVVMIEDIINDNGVLKITSPPAPWQHIRQIGEDICAGEMAFPSYTVLNPASLGVLISAGIEKVKVLKQINIGIIPTGDEIVKPKKNPAQGELLEFNSVIFSSMLAQYSAKSIIYDIAADDLNIIKNALIKASKECDFIILIAGSSKGRGDYAYEAIAQTGQVLLHGVSIRPGKPVILGSTVSVPVVGVPGYPVSGIIVVEKFVIPAIEKMSRIENRIKKDSITAILSRKIISPLKYEEFVRCKVANIGGRYIATPLGSGASIVSSFAKSDGIIIIGQNEEGKEAGNTVEVELNRHKTYVDNCISVTGSHDPLIDEISDILEIMNCGIHLSSSHVGSMGGIMAIKRKETHAAGIHLLDELTGEYNITYVKKYFPQHNVKLIRGVGRTQGIMVQKGNPQNIKNINDLNNGNIRYVNRQKGAGTRILLDYLLKKNYIDTALIYGYEREEMTHLSVAAQIQAGSADAGLGIYSAAKAFELDFIPVYEEEYDILISDDFYNSEKYNKFIAVLKSEEFAWRLKKLGGYSIKENIGEVLL